MHQYFRIIQLNEFLYFYLNGKLVYSQNDNSDTDETILKTNIIECIKQNDITVPIYFLELFDIFELSEYNDNIEYDIEFSYNNEIISFHTKNHKFYECESNNKELKKDVIDKFTEFTQNKQNMLLVINNLNNSCPMDIYNLKELFFKKNILLDHSNDYSLLDNLPDKYKIILLENRDENLFNYVKKKSKNFVKCLLKSYKFILLNFCHSLDYVPKLIHGKENIPQIFWDSLYAGYHPIIKNRYNWFNKFNSFFSNTFPMPLVKYGITNRDVLSKEDFFKLHKLDSKKKTVTFFLSKFLDTWSTVCNFNTVENMYLRTNKLKDLISFLSKDYNVIIRIHPSKIDIKNKNFNLKKIDVNTINIDKKIFNSIEDILNLYRGLNIIEDQFKLEVFKYTDYGINFDSWTSMFELLYLYNIPLLHIHNCNYNLDEYIKQVGVKYFVVKEISDINPLNVINRRYNFLYGKVYHDNDIKQNNKQLYQAVTLFLKTDHSKTYKYFKNNPYYDNEYYNDYKTVVDVVTAKINKIML